MGVFDEVLDAFSSVTGFDVTTAGFILGLIVIIVIVTSMALALREAISGLGLAIPAGLGVIFIVLVGWWPLWTIIFIALIVAMVVMRPFGGSGRI